MKEKKVLIITNDFYPSRGGIQACIRGLAGNFDGDIMVFAPYYPGYNVSLDKQFNFSVVRTDSLRQDRFVDRLLFLILRRPLTFLLRTLFKIFRVGKSKNFSCILCGHFTNIPSGYFLKKIKKVPLGTIVHGRELFFRGILSPLKRLLAKYLLNKADKLFMSNLFMKKRLIEMGIPEEKIVMIPFGVNFSDKSDVHSKKRESIKKIILTVGRLVERKGHSSVIESLPMVLRRIPDVTYQIVGKGPMEKRLRLLVKEKNLSNYVEFCGEVENLVPYYYDCDIFVMPSKFIKDKGDVEGFGLVFLEANFFGKPVIAGRTGGVSDAVIDGVTGILVNPEDPKDIADAVIRLFDDPKLAKRLGKQGRKRVVEEFTWERAARIIEQTMGEVKREKSKSKK
ncbi:glycosyltransferase family 4 protein [candidate division WOR-3 bacterium]|nr:glycosyltransferase family 4 protein [candidate division WOR-3 bacterium]